MEIFRNYTLVTRIHDLTCMNSSISLWPAVAQLKRTCPYWFLFTLALKNADLLQIDPNGGKPKMVVDWILFFSSMKSNILTPTVPNIKKSNKRFNNLLAHSCSVCAVADCHSVPLMCFAWHAECAGIEHGLVRDKYFENFSLILAPKTVIFVETPPQSSGLGSKNWNNDSHLLIIL